MGGGILLRQVRAGLLTRCRRLRKGLFTYHCQNELQPYSWSCRARIRSAPAQIFPCPTNKQKAKNDKTKFRNVPPSTPPNSTNRKRQRLQPELEERRQQGRWRTYMVCRDRRLYCP